MTRLLRTPFAVAVLACLVLVGWALWTAGIFDGPIARDVRTSSVYAAPGVDLDEPAAERIIGNRRLVAVFLEEGADLAEGCDDVQPAADGNVVMLLSPDGDEFEHYGCALFGSDDENDEEDFGKKYVAEATVANGVDQFVDDPIKALKVMAVNYDRLVKAGIVPDGARTISPSLPRYLIAAAAVAAVLVGATLAYLAARRAGRLAAAHREQRDTAADARDALSARAAVLARRLIALDGRYTRSTNDKFKRRYRKLAADYAELVADFAAADERGEVDPTLHKRVRALTHRCRELAGAQG